MKNKNNFKLSISSLSKSELEKREQSTLRGGHCTCGCHYEGNGGSSTCDNSGANFDGGYHSVGGGDSCSSGVRAEHQFFIC